MCMSNMIGSILLIRSILLNFAITPFMENGYARTHRDPMFEIDIQSWPFWPTAPCIPYIWSTTFVLNLGDQ